MRLQDKVALITGAGSNIGRAMARLFAREGAAVVVGDTDETGGGETVRLIEAWTGHGPVVCPRGSGGGGRRYG